MPTDLTAAMDGHLRAHLATKRFMGTALVTRGHDILLRRAYGMANLEHAIPHTPQTVFRIASVSKQFTAAAILQLQEKGSLRVHAPVADYLPGFPNGQRITLHHLLTHTSGIPSYAPGPDNPLNGCRSLTIDEIIALFADKPPDFEPGARWQYGNSGYVLLAKIIEVVSGRSYATYLQQHIFQPLGMTDSGHDTHALILPRRATGYILTDSGEYAHAAPVYIENAIGAGSLYSTADDLLKWDRALYTDAVLNAGSRRAQFTPYVLHDANESATLHHGYGWRIDRTMGRTNIHHGGRLDDFGSIITRFPEDELAVIILNNIGGTHPYPISLDLAAMCLGEPPTYAPVGNALA